jgi:rhamnopyranosyl-N-acetylglucosaminyl-diphospho-decaprenol beta-1,3/1,4-galactofuranosyltransferase
MKIIAVVVTYNRCQLLERCLNYLQAQVRVPDKILVINHSSTDGTQAMLDACQIDYITQPNLGSSAGWNRGIEYALEHGFDAVWLMDDDGFPHSKALSYLEKGLLSDRACVSSVVMQENNPEHFVFPFPRLNKKNIPVIFAKPRKIKTLAALKAGCPDNAYPFAHFFNGALISCSAIKLVGNVNKAFFIYGDEVDYFFRLRKIGKVMSILDAIHYHPDVAQRPYNDIKIYYYLKNSLILNQRYFDYVWFRHIMTLMIVLYRTSVRNGWRDFIKCIVNPMFYRAFFRGLQGKLGHDHEAI